MIRPDVNIHTPREWQLLLLGKYIDSPHLSEGHDQHVKSSSLPEGTAIKRTGFPDLEESVPGNLLLVVDRQHRVMHVDQV